jgi:hypothetical protein
MKQFLIFPGRKLMQFKSDGTTRIQYFEMDTIVVPPVSDPNKFFHPKPEPHKKYAAPQPMVKIINILLCKAI